LDVLDLFSGIGGFSLGLERAGLRTVGFCEIDPYCRRVLAKHWPAVPVHDDVRTFDGVPAEVICGGFPCQDISVAGRGAGIAGERSGLWSEYARIIGEVRPRYVIVENVAALLGRGLERVLGDLAALGFDAEWHCIPACAVGAPHRRDRVWIVAYAAIERCKPGDGYDPRWATASFGRRLGDGSEPFTVADACEPRLSPSECDPILRAGWWDEGRAAAECGWWRVEPDVGRVAHGVPARVDRLRALGNAIVPQIAEVIGRAIMAREG
jgi:DNA (cytosine-5)-methyltransferase 1